MKVLHLLFSTDQVNSRMKEVFQFRSVAKAFERLGRPVDPLGNNLYLFPEDLFVKFQCTEDLLTIDLQRYSITDSEAISLLIDGELCSVGTFLLADILRASLDLFVFNAGHMWQRYNLSDKRSHKHYLESFGPYLKSFRKIRTVKMGGRARTQILKTHRKFSNTLLFKYLRKDVGFVEDLTAQTQEEWKEENEYFSEGWQTG